MVFGAAGGGVGVLLQGSSQGVQTPFVPLLASVAAIAVLAALVVGSFVRPSMAPSQSRAAKALESPKPVVKATTVRRAPVRIMLPQVKEGYPDVWGPGETIEIRFQITDKALAAKAKPAGLTVHVAGEPIAINFQKGRAAIKRTFKELGEIPVSVQLEEEGRRSPARTTRRIRIVDYRKEIAEVFHKFRDEAGRVIAPVPEDATPWEVLDLLTSANPNVPEAKLRTIVECFEEAKFSNHPVDRSTYERMIDALLALERVEL